MQCPRCLIVIPDDSKFCSGCGKKLVRSQNPKRRGNGAGSVYQLPNGKWRAVITAGYWIDENGKKHRSVASKSGFIRKKDALTYLEELRNPGKKKKLEDVTFKELFDKWQPTHKRGKSTMNCYNAAMNYFESLWYENLIDIDIDDLQECLDECPMGKRTRQNMKALVGLMYKYGIPRNLIPSGLNLGKYLIVGDGESVAKESFADEQIELIRQHIGKVEYADYIYAHIYLGFRPTELLRLDAKDYNRKERAFIGGIKTEAGKNRTVTISPKIQPIIDRLTDNKIAGPVFCDANGNRMTIKAYRKVFYAALEAIGIDNPKSQIGGKDYRKYTPHTCRHTFATLMKRVPGAEKDKLELIGHASGEMLRFYQDVHYDDLRRITDAM